MAVVVFDIPAFRLQYPEFSKLTDDQLDYFFSLSEQIILGSNEEGSLIPYDPETGVIDRANVLNLLVCHLCTLALRGQGVVGTLSSGAEGNVNASLTIPQIKNAEWFCQTQCGLTYWQITARYRGMRYYGYPGIWWR